MTHAKTNPSLILLLIVTLAALLMNVNGPTPSLPAPNVPRYVDPEGPDWCTEDNLIAMKRLFDDLQRYEMVSDNMAVEIQAVAARVGINTARPVDELIAQLLTAAALCGAWDGWQD